MRLVIKGTAEPLVGEFDVPASKYHAHRALMLASLADGTSRIHGACHAGHVQHTIRALRDLGTAVTVEDDAFVVHGGRYRPVRPEISVGSSGTTLYFLTGLAALADTPVGITGQKYFRRRPIRPLLDALAGIGVEISSTGGLLPIRVAARPPTGGRVRIPGTLSQWISSLLLVSPFATGPTTIEVVGEFNERSYVDLTVAMMRQFGLHVQVSGDGRRYDVEPGQRPTPAVVRLPPDVGAAAFGLAATALHPSDVLFRGLPAVPAGELDHPEAHLLDSLTTMGVPLTRDPATGWIRVRHDGLRLAPVRVDCRAVPDMLPVLSVLGSHAHGTTVLDNVAHVRLKESDRVTAMLQLNRMGGRLRLDGDRLVCEGVGQLREADLSSFNDHRVLMALAVAASRATGETRLTYPNAHRISFPQFLEQMNAVGLNMSVDRARARRLPRPAAGEPAGRLRPDNPPPARPSPVSPAGTPPGVTPAPTPTSSVGLPAPTPPVVTPTPSGGVSARGRSVALPSPARLAETPVAELVRRHAGARPDAEAVIEAASPGRPGTTLSWGELDRRADQAASLLRELGVGPGEVVAWQLPNWTEFVVLTLATTRIGAVCCPLMPFFREREMGRLLRRSRARVLVVPDRFRGRAHLAETAAMLAGPDAPGVAHVLVVAGHTTPDGHPTADGTVIPAGTAAPADAAGLPADTTDLRWQWFGPALARQRPDGAAPAAHRPHPAALAQLMFTSGTSGEPKGVLHRVDTLTRAAAMQARHLGLTAADRLFIPSPLAHQTGFLYGMWLGFTIGAPVVLQPIWDGRTALETLHHTRSTFVQAATPFLADLVEAVETGGQPPPALRVFVATGAAVPRNLAEHATRTLGAAVCGAWGSTESCLGTLSAPTDAPAHAWGTDGRALEGIRIRVTDDAGTVLGPGVEGNFEVAGDCLFAGYLDRPDLTAAALTPDGWYRSGDLATIDDAGYLRITGRVTDVVNRGGEKIPVAEVEQLLHTHPAVREVAIVAMPDPRLGERACAFVVTRGAFGFAEMQRFLDAHKVAKQYWPERLETVTALPRNVVGKVQKFVLRDQISATIGEEAE
ncbi:3-phosphoshikimate 1-carboxyvinyltransferase [Micromonospora sp. RL09-050-HVF-A]|uniref:3-phosphoshikimate 1-carboxyvinyltransferase n=1 Tax=Micromonospora sp. RL09-050-HVF-A TaxID=1703433 RepID=UPI001C5EFC7C|nr:3-phosphoshikimate 1-carboxyvinyltransferase [Micromonospora sp. RL09-050-HVF-A]MBW4701620.1 3-phosphoshikimate 1-carboxyvinyltransferase [Micromonospora sp. RL09-050-HVF-A]